MQKTQIIKFLRDYTVKDRSGTKYMQGQVIELPYASAQHFLTRNVAILNVIASAAPEPQPPAEPEPEKAKRPGRPPKTGDN